MANENLHASFPPSGMSRILACPASWQAERRVPSPPSSPFAERGTILHEVVPKIWNDRHNMEVVRAVMSTYRPDLERVYHAMGDNYDDTAEKECTQYVLQCTDYLATILTTCGENWELHFETRVTLASFGLKDIWGTADIIIADPANGRIIVIDWKFGSGVKVYAEDNIQGLTYLTGAVGNPIPPWYKDFEIHIVQPPADNYTSWVVDLERIHAHVSTLSAGVAAAKATNAPYHADEDNQCRFCNYKDKCKARFDAIQDNADTLFAAFKKIPEIGNEELGLALQSLAQVEQAKKSLTNLVTARLLEGEKVPGWKIIYGRSNRKWVDEGAALKWMKKMKVVDEEDLFTQKLISCSQAEKLNRKLKKSEQFQALWHKPEGSPKLAPDTHAGEEYVTADAGVSMFKSMMKGETS